MGRALRLALLGVPVGGGGALPESITDDFSADSGLWLDGNLAAAAMTVSGGKGIWAPTEGAEIHTSANAASDPNGNEANATTGWLGAGVELAVESSDVDTGSYAIKGTAADGSSDRAYFPWTDATRGWIVQRCAAKQVSGTTWRLGSNFTALLRPSISITSAWADYLMAFYKSADSTGHTGIWLDGGAANNVALMDNLSLKLLTPATTVRLQRIYYPSALSVKTWGQNYLPKGLIVYKDANNWVAAVQTRNSSTSELVALLKCVGGVASIVGTTGTITYSAGAVLELIPAADFQTWTVKYDGTTEVNAAAITDFAASGTWYAGLLNTYDAGDMSIAFDDYSATRIAESPPF